MSTVLINGISRYVIFFLRKLLIRERTREILENLHTDRMHHSHIYVYVRAHSHKNT